MKAAQEREESRTCVHEEIFAVMPQFESDSSAYAVGIIVGLVGGVLIIVLLYFVLRGVLGIAEQETADEIAMSALRKEAGVQQLKYDVS